jgi:hypothetical protein
MPVSQPLMIPISDNLYQLVETYTYEWSHLGADQCLVIPMGTITDGASVPRIAWTISGITPDGLIRAAALLHDVLYRVQGQVGGFGLQQIHIGGRWIKQASPWTREQADKLFARVMREAGVRKIQRRAAYLMVRAFGWSSWNNANFDLVKVQK